MINMYRIHGEVRPTDGHVLAEIKDRDKGNSRWEEEKDAA